MAAPRYTPAQKVEALDLYRTHGPTHVDKQLGIPKGTVAGWARETGVQTVRNDRTRAATVAASLDAKSRRQKIIARLYGQAEKMLDDLEAPTFQTLVRGMGGAEEAEELSFVPTADRRALIQSINTATSNALALDKVDADNGVHAAESMLGKLVEGIGVPDE